MRNFTAPPAVFGALAALSAMGIMRAVRWLHILQRSDWKSVPVPLEPGLLLFAAAAGWLVWLLLSWLLSHAADIPRRKVFSRIGLALAPGCLGWMVPPLGTKLLAAASDLAFEKLGFLRLGNAWIPVPSGIYLAMGLLGLALMGMVFAVAAAFWRHARSPWPALACALFLAGAWRILVFPPSGDEPYTLMTTSSLLRGGEMDLRDDFARGDEQLIHAHSFRKDFLDYHRVKGPHGAEYAYHGFLFSVLYLPGYAIGGRVGLQALLALAWVLLLAQLASALRQGGIPPDPARTTLVLLAVASPLPYFVVFLGPDFPSALLLLLGMVAALKGQRGLALACIAGLPWIHHKSALLAIGLTLGVAVLRGRSWGLPAAGVLLASGTALMALLATAVSMPLWPPQSVLTFGASMHGHSLTLGNIPRSMLGLLFDRYRSAVYHPALYLAFAGLILMRHRAKQLVFLLACAAPYLAVLVTFRGAVTHPGAPGRELVALLPLAAIPLGVAVSHLKARNWGRTLLRFCLAFGALSLLAQAAMPALAFVSAKRRIEEALETRLGFTPFSLLPDIGSAPPDLSTFLHAAALAALLLIALMLLVRALPARQR